MNYEYEKPVLDFMMFENEDVITTSCIICGESDHSTLDHIGEDDEEI